MATQVLADLSAELVSKGPKPLPHLTEVLYCLTKSYYDRLQPLPPNPQESLIFVLGVGLEQSLLRPHKKHSSGQYEGLFFEADFLTLRQNVGELKTTRLSAKKGPNEFPETWTQQILGYLKCLGRTEAALIVLHLMGTYNPPFPQLKAWRLVATQEEIDSNWQWLQDRKAVYLSHVKEQIVPKQFKYNREWECTNCRYKLICDARQAAESATPQS